MSYDDRHRSRLMLLSAGLLMALPALARAEGPALDEWRVKRENVFQFATRPTVTRDGDKATIAFETTAFCDATVAIEDADGRIVRHLASGVLGPNAPAPFQKNAKRQVVVWDGKNDQDAYVKDVEAMTVRVSLGLQPHYERSLSYSPMKPPNYRADPARVMAAPEGVYVFANGPAGVSFLRLFDHDGNYVRTVYPFPADRLAKVTGLIGREFPQTGKTYPAKWGLNQNTFLTGGHLESGSGWPESAAGDPAQTLAVRDGRVALLSQRLTRLTSQGDSGGMDLLGPKLFFDLPMSRVHSFEGGLMRACPRSAAFSPDGRTLYLAGYFYSNAWRLNFLNGVAKVDFAAGRDASAEVFAGVMSKGKHGKGPGEFHFPIAVATDAKGRVYVADYLNDRVQVFDATGKHLKDIAANKPADIAIHHRTGEIYVFSWYFRSDDLSEIQGEYEKKRQRLTIPSVLTRMGPFEDPKVRATMPLPLPGAAGGDFGHPGEYFDVTLDSWAEPARLWIVGRGNWRGGDIEPQLPKLYVERDGKLELARSYTDEIVKATGRLLPPRHGRVRTFVNPADGDVYLGESHTLNAKSFNNLVHFDGATGRLEGIAELPFHSEDAAFDADGQIYLRTEDTLVRYFLAGAAPREIPFDYGEELTGVGYSPHASGRFARVVSGVKLPSEKPGYWIMGGLAVSPRGRVAIACHNPGVAASREGEAAVASTPKYKPLIYPGRPVGWEIHVLDKHGKMAVADALPGSRQMFGIGLDRDDNLYCMTPARRMLPDGEPYPNDASCTVIKAKAGEAKFLSAGRDGVPVPLENNRPDFPPQIERGLYDGKAWVLGAEWFYGGVGNAAKYIGRAGGGCWCQYAQMTLDHFARTFAPEPDIYSVAVIDSAGNLVLRIGQYGNIDDGQPLDASSKTAATRGVGGDEVTWFDPQHPAVHTDRRLFVSDVGNGRVVSIRLDYHATERVELKGK